MTNVRSRSPLRREDFTQPTLAEDLLKASGYWKGDNETCRVCLKSLFETVKNQGFFIRELERSIAMRVSVAEFQAALASKADFLDVSRKVDEVRSLIDKKASINDVELCINLSKPTLDSFKFTTNSFQNNLNNTSDFKEIQENINKSQSKFKSLFETKLQEFTYKIETFESMYQEISSKIKNWEKSLNDVQKKYFEIQEIIGKVNLIEEKINEFKFKPSNEETLKFSFGDNTSFNLDKKKMLELIESKVDVKVFQQEFMNLRSLVHSTLTEFGKRTQILSNPSKPQEFETLRTEMSQKWVKIEEKIEYLSKNKPDKSEIRNILHDINNKLHEKLLNISRNLFDEKENIGNSKPIKVDNSALSILSTKLDELQKDLLLKASIKDLCTLLDMKANIEEVNIALVGIHTELDQKNSIFPQGIWSFFNNDSGSLVFKHLKSSSSLQVNLDESSGFIISKSGFFTIDVIIFSEHSNNFAILKNGKKFLSCAKEKNGSTGLRLCENVELVDGDQLELVLPGLVDVRGNFCIWEILI